MGNSFLICYLEEIISEEDFFQSQQKTLLDDEGPSELTYQQVVEQFYLGLNKYSAHNDLRVNSKGRTKNHVFNFYYQPYKFNFYLNQDTNLLLIRVKTDVATDFVGKLNSQKALIAFPIKINFQKFISQIENISGAWFADLKKNHLSSAGYFGKNVKEARNIKKLLFMVIFQLLLFDTNLHILKTKFH
ncbi:hypothetical protein ACFPYN_02885 [Paenisporosarcina macmurdoensis]|uniref:Uncharacterized protein n=1 Tax=Paenisporosarcina macmurdoensis TaxID=212659 RepID=A0ABW1L532_9BACL